MYYESNQKPIRVKTIEKEIMRTRSFNDSEENFPAISRGIYLLEEEEGDADWIRVLHEGFQFTNVEDCEDFIKKHCISNPNPKMSSLFHLLTTTVSWHQMTIFLIKKMDYYNRVFQPNIVIDDEHIKENVFMRDPSGYILVKLLRETMSKPTFSLVTTESTMNSLKYLFYNIRCGVFVMIRRQKVAMFVPFANKDYTNSGWAENLQFARQYQNQPDLYYEAKWMFHRKENLIQEKRNWWNDGPVLGNEHRSPGVRGVQYISDRGMAQWRSMLDEACRKRFIPDCEFFINPLKHPTMKIGDDGRLVEPCGFLFDRDDLQPSEDIPLQDHVYVRHTPVASPYTHRRAADLRWPTPEDWEIATGKIFPSSFIHQVRQVPGGEDQLTIEPVRSIFSEKNMRLYVKQQSWDEKRPIAFFRGSVTGAGATPSTNQRLKLAQMSQRMAEDEREPSFLDAKLTLPDLKDKKMKGQPLDFVRQDRLDIDISSDFYEPIYKQNQYKYLIYVEGNAASARYSFMMRTLSVILKVESQCQADELWFFPLLRPMVDHIPVKADLSDLISQIRWCREHDADCKRIAENAFEMHKKFLSKGGILDYIQLFTHNISMHCCPMPPWWERPSINSRVPTMNLPKNKCADDKKRGPKLCARCEHNAKQESLKAMEAHEEQLTKEQMKEDKTKEKRNILRSRMKSKKRVKTESLA